MNVRAPLLGLVLAAIAATGARAETPAAAVQAYAAGNFMDAAALAETRRAPDSLAFAARALMAECIVSHDNSRAEALADRAVSAARTALRLDPNSVEARLQFAVALGVRGRLASLSEAWAHGYAPHGRDLIQQALALSPNDPWAHALMGGWNLEVIRRGGTAGAIAYGARERVGIAEFERARALAPDDPMITLHYAIAILELDPERYGARAASLLAAATALPPRDAFETLALANARRVADTLESNGAKAAAEVARALFL